MQVWQTGLCLHASTRGMRPKVGVETVCDSGNVSDSEIRAATEPDIQGPWLEFSVRLAAGNFSRVRGSSIVWRQISTQDRLREMR